MGIFLLIFSITPQLCSGALSIDRFKLEMNRTVGIMDLKYVNNEKGMAIMNVTADIFHIITKAMVYFKVNIVIRKDGRDYSQEFMATRVDLGKLLKGLYGNFLLKSFMENLMSDIKALNLTVPVQAVSRAIY